MCQSAEQTAESDRAAYKTVIRETARTQSFRRESEIVAVAEPSKN